MQKLAASEKLLLLHLAFRAGIEKAPIDRPDDIPGREQRVDHDMIDQHTNIRMGNGLEKDGLIVRYSPPQSGAQSPCCTNVITKKAKFHKSR